MLKRCFDIIGAALGLIILLPLFLLLAIWIRLDSPGPVFFRQERIGRFGHPFRIFKFRTMGIDAEKQGQLTVGLDCRVTRAGQWLRKTKLDELPQLIDVLRGKMSLVGPRPEVARYVNHYPSDVQNKILSLRPGITDWAALHMIDENELLGQAQDPETYYLNEILPQKLNYYISYADHHSLKEDLVIILKTMGKMFYR